MNTTAEDRRRRRRRRHRRRLSEIHEKSAIILLYNTPRSLLSLLGIILDGGGYSARRSIMISRVRSFAVHAAAWVGIALKSQLPKIKTRRLATKHRIALLLLLSLYITRVTEYNVICSCGVYNTISNPWGGGSVLLLYFC
jgi:hypothetical protein